MKRFTLSVVMTAVLGLAAYSIADAQGPGRHGFGQGGPGGPGGPGGRGAAMGLLRGLDLTEQQQAQLKALREADRDSRQGPPADVTLRRQLQTELFADVPDDAKVASLQDQLAAAQSERLAKEVAAEQKIAQVLTAEQRAQVRQRLEQGPAARGGRGPGDRHPAGF